MKLLIILSQVRAIHNALIFIKKVEKSPSDSLQTPLTPAAGLSPDLPSTGR